ncbi:MAG: hypothetical protein HZA49_04055 [Planctomycetes bacterium]|nr:hypothetical protein [Planctomycetota bacterium]
MSEIKSAVRFFIPSVLPPADLSVDQWTEDLKVNAMRINQKRELAVPDEGAYQSKLAEPSGRGFKVWTQAVTALTRSGLDAATVIGRQLGKIKSAFGKWQSNLAKPFATIDGIEAKIFKEAVDEKSSHWADGVTISTMRFTGDVREPGAVPLAVRWLSGDNLSRIRSGDLVINGSPLSVVAPALQKTLRAALTQQLVQSGVVIVQTNYDPTVMDKQNEVINSVLKKLQEPSFVEFQKTIVTDKSFCVYRMLDGQLYLEIQVVIP